MFQSLVKPVQPTAQPPKGYVKVTNNRAGEILLPCPPKVLPPGVSYHDESLFDAMSAAIVEGLQAHQADGDLKFESADVAPPPPVPERFIPPPVVGEEPASVPALSVDPVEAAKQIAAETNEAILSSWFDSGQSVEISDLLLARHSALNPS